MLSLTKGYDAVHKGISATLLTTWMQCREKARLKYHERWKPLKPSFPMMFGSMTHEVIERTFRAQKSSPDDRWLQKQIREVVRATQEEYGGRLNEYLAQAVEDSEGMMCAVLPHYFDRYQDDFKKCAWEFIEDDFSFTLPEVVAPFHGRYDRVFRLKGKGLWLVETKTKSRIEEDNLMETLHFDLQNAIYLLSLWKKFDELPKGVIYDVIRRPALKRRDNETLPKFLERVSMDIKSRPEEYFMRFEVSVVKSDLELMQKELVVVANEFIKWNYGKSPTWKNTTACVARYGLCEYAPICGCGDFSMHMRKPREEANETKR